MKHFHPYQALVVIVLTVFTIELTLHLYAEDIFPFGYIGSEAFETAIMAVIITPLVYFFSIRPLRMKMEETEQINAELLRIRTDLNRAQEVAHIGSWYLDIQKNELIWSKESHEIFGVPPGTPDINYERFLAAVHPDDRPYVHKMWTAAMRGAPYDIEHRVIANGVVRWVRERAQVDFDANGQALRGIGTTEDITDRKEKEGQIANLTRVYKTLSACNKALVRARTEQELFENICKAATEYGGYRMAWVGLKNNDERKTITPIAYAGYEDGYLKMVNVTWADTERGRGPTGTAVRTGMASVNNNTTENPAMSPWREEALKRGYLSTIGLPLFTEGEIIGALTMYTSDANAFNENEIKLLEELADDLSFGIVALRTQKKQEAAEEALKKSLDLLDKTQRISKVGGWEHIIATGQTTWTDEIYRIFEIEKGAYDSNDPEKAVRFFVPEDQGKIRLAFQRVNELGEAYDLTLRVKTAQGKTIWARTTGQAEQKNGQIVRTFGNIMDITETKELENKLRVSSAYTRSLIEASLDPLVTISSSGKITDVNKATEEATGLERSLLVGTDFANYFTEPDKARTGYEQVFMEGSVVNYPLAIRHKDGHTTDVLYNASLYRDETGKVLGVFAAARDITERKNMEVALREQTELLHAVPQSALDAFILMDSNGIIVDWNHQAENIFNWPRAEAIGRVLAETIIPPRYRDAHIHGLAHFLKTQEGPMLNTRVEIFAQRRDGNEFPIELSITPIKRDNKYLFSAFVRDITERKNMEASLYEKDRHAQSLLRLSKELELAQTYTHTLNAARDEVKAILGYQNLWVFLFTEDKKEAHALFAGGPTSEAVLSEEGAGALTIEGDRMLEEIVDSKDIVIVEDARIDPRTDKAMVAKMGNRTIVNVPIIFFDKHFGSVGTGTFDNEGVRVPTKAEKEYLRALASHLAVTLDRVHLFDERKKSEENLRVRDEELEQTNFFLLAAKNKIEQSKAQDEALLASIGEGIIATDHEGKIIFTNRAAEEILGYSAKYLIGKDLIATVPSVDGAGAIIHPEKRVLTEALLSGKLVTSNTTSFPHRNGKVTPVAITATPIFLNKELIGAVEVFRDITKERELENTRRDLLSLASHQLRTPLSGTKWLIETLQKGIHGPLNEKQTEYLQEIYKINERMTQLVFDMLNVLRVESGVGGLKEEKLSVQDLLTKIVEVFNPAAKNKRVTLRIANEENPIIMTDREILRNIIDSFVSNAITYSMPGTEATIEVTKDDKEVVIAIKDSGIGIPKNEQRQIFERFYRASNARTFNTRGTGLGLYIAATLAKKIGARLSFESEEGRGSTFAVHVPLYTEK